MEIEHTSYISVFEPISPAIERVKMILFKPFDLAKWFVIGFCAFLANLGSGGGGNGGGGNGGGPPGGNPPNFGHMINQAKEYVIQNISWILPLVVIGFVLIVTLMLVFAWLSSRGRFMLLHCVARNKAEVKVPWAQFREHANSLFLFRIALGFIGLIVIAIPVIITIILIVNSISNDMFTQETILSLIFLGLGILILSLCLAAISKFTTDFVVPIMFLRTTSVRAAWHEFLSILSVNKARFFVYLLFHIVISIAIGIIVLACVLLTCCCACCFLILPYIKDVALLPIHIFKRSYSLYYLRQFGQQFNIFDTEPENPQPFVSENPYGYK